MTDVYFYRVIRSSTERTLLNLLQRATDTGFRVLVRASEWSRIRQLDEYLWLFDDETFLPHGVAGTENESHQPVLLTATEGNPNRAGMLVHVEGCPLDLVRIASFERVRVIFDGKDPDQLDTARRDWKAVTEAGVQAVYWTDESGKWAEVVRKDATAAQAG
ncbi:MAG: DNA polymerase III subunit chi [Paracoccaceae bacterium]|nr:DNA polymerase III subunit chi [Paracoccaceae bacterium]MDE2911838.1 DNA polymerase III subunit chi [Paracoccaceae bacterium]